MRVSGVAPLIAVRDVARSVAFYERLGFVPEVRWPTYARLAAGENMVLHIAEQGGAPPDRPSVALTAPSSDGSAVSAIVVVQVPDCRRACAELTTSGVELLTEPATPAWGGEIRAFVRDPDGHLIELNERLD
ncbi:VOC family protein [Actinomadura sp. ATCC 31491]|uniref:VOC family protein n=1 Tax=Actinomadura luzonensis TaxID=2805427 RepID=A0ABT0G241_9ACTN|nr:VOC family protein [Actinomadura luzonensis]MCK2218188.1 VOC family protein [Actinomadura luzonensis]